MSPDHKQKIAELAKEYSSMFRPDNGWGAEISGEAFLTGAKAAFSLLAEPQSGQSLDDFIKKCSAAGWSLDYEKAFLRKEAAALLADVQALRARDAAEIERLRAELEHERLRLAACGVAAMQNTEDSIREYRISEDSPCWSASYGDACRAVDREIAERQARQAAEARLRKPGE